MSAVSPQKQISGQAGHETPTVTLHGPAVEDEPAEPYTRDDFMRDLTKVTQPKDERSGSGS